MDRRYFLKASAAVVASGTVAGPAIAGGHGRIGEFTGLSNHITTGRGELADNEVVLLSDFSFDGAPDPRVGLGKDGTYDEATDMGALESNSGKQKYALPDGVNAKDYNEIYIWCRKFSVPLGVAVLN